MILEPVTKRNHVLETSSKRSADLSFRSAVFCCQLGTGRRPPKQVRATLAFHCEESHTSRILYT